MTTNLERLKIERELENKDFYDDGKVVYFRFLNNIYFLERTEFYRRKNFLEKALAHIEDSSKRQFHVYENLVFGSKMLEKEEKKRKITIVYESAFCCAFKVENEEED
jgi:hypothetical protein